MGRALCALWGFQHCNNLNSIAMRNLTPRNWGILCRELSIWTWCHGLMWVRIISTGALFYNGGRGGYKGWSVGCVHFVTISTPYKVQYANWSNATNTTNQAMWKEECCYFCRENLGPFCLVPIFSNFVFYLKYQLQWPGLWHCYAGPCSIDSVHWCGHYVKEFLK